ALAWFPENGSHGTELISILPGRAEHRRHTRKYAEGQLVPERSFYFRGPEGKLNLRAYNLVVFLELAAGVDDGTWLHHLQAHDYSRWFAEVIGDESLADEAVEIEGNRGLSPRESRDRLRAAVERRYTLPDNPSLPRVANPRDADPP